MNTVGRLAPSPSGRMHIGNAFSYLMAWLAARSQGGHVVLRIDDIDPRAASPELAQLVIDDLGWLGLEWDEGPYYQHERCELYEAAVQELEEADYCYPCFCTRAELHAASAPHASDGTYIYPGTCRDLTPDEVARKSALRSSAIRLKVPNENDETGKYVVEDLIYGHSAENLARDCGDFLVRRSDGVFAYQLASVIDDAELGVTQVVRGRDLLGSCARQMYLQDLLGLCHVMYAHIPLLVDSSGRRLAKRDHDVSLEELRKAQVKPQKLITQLGAYAGLCEPLEELELDDLVERFSFETLRDHTADIVVK